jgi:DNA-binding transcriptional ArsR family regulator
MGITKTQSFNQRQNTIATYAKVIGHPARVAIIDYLLKHNSCICNDLVEEFPLSQSTISQHLKELKQVGIIKGEIEGPKMCYCIDEKVWKEIQEIFSSMFNSYTPISKCC